MANDGEVVGGVSRAHRGPVLAKLDSDGPMKAVFDFPVAAHRMCNPLCTRRQGTDVAAALTARLCADGPFAIDDGERPATAHFRSTVPLFTTRRCGICRQRTAHASLDEQEGFDEFGMVILHAPHVVGAAFTDRLRNARLGAHRVDGDHTASSAGVASSSEVAMIWLDFSAVAT